MLTNTNKLFACGCSALILLGTTQITNANDNYASTITPYTVTQFGDSLSDTHENLDIEPGVNNNWFVAQSALQNFPVSSIAVVDNTKRMGTWVNFFLESNDNFTNNIIPWRIAQKIGNINVVEYSNSYAFVSALSGDNFTNDQDLDDPSTINDACFTPGLLTEGSSCVPGYIKQVDMYITDLEGQPIPNNAVYVSWIGANDLLASLQSLLPKIESTTNENTLIKQHAFDSLSQADRYNANYLQMLIDSGVSVDDPRWQAATKESVKNFTIESEITIQEIVNNITMGLQILLDNGAAPSQLYAFGTPALEDAPIAIKTIAEAGPLGPLLRQVIELVTIEFNDLLSESVEDMGIHFFSTNDVLQEVLAEPMAFGFDPDKVETSCVADAILDTDVVGAPFPLCVASTTAEGTQLFYMFTDDTGHPTYQLHKVLGEKFADVVELN